GELRLQLYGDLGFSEFLLNPRCLTRHQNKGVIGAETLLNVSQKAFGFAAKRGAWGKCACQRRIGAFGGTVQGAKTKNQGSALLQSFGHLSSAEEATGKSLG